MKSRYIYKNGEVIYAEERGVVTIDRREEMKVGQAPMVMNDIKPYQSMIDGSEITSRSRHREHLQRHGCIEVGNEKMKPKEYRPPPGLKDDVLAAYKKTR